MAASRYKEGEGGKGKEERVRSGNKVVARATTRGFKRLFSMSRLQLGAGVRRCDCYATSPNNRIG